MFQRGVPGLARQRCLSDCSAGQALLFRISHTERCAVHAWVGWGVCGDRILKPCLALARSVCAASARVVMGDPGGAEAALSPHRGFVHVDKCTWTGHWWLSHTVTWERTDLGAYGQVQPIFDDDDGSCILLCEPLPSLGADDEPAHRFVDEELDQDLYQDAHGRFLVLRRGSQIAEFIEDRVDQFAIVDVVLRCGSQNLKCPLEAAAMKHPGFMEVKMRWSLHHLFDGLGLHAHKGQRWQWVSKNMEVWRSWVRNLFPTHTHCFLKALVSDIELMDRPDSPALPWPSCSTVGLLALLLRWWASPSPQAGALSESAARDAAQAMFRALVDCLGGDPFVMNLLLSEAAKLRYPRPAAGRNPTTLKVSADLRVELWAADLEDLPDASDPVATWYLRLAATTPSMHLVDFMQAVCSWRPRRPRCRFALLAQVIAQVAAKVDRRVLRLYRAGAAVQGQRLVATRREFDPRKCSPSQVTAHLVKYLQAQRDKLRLPVRYLSVASDKSRVLGCSLLSTAIATLDNSASWAFPLAIGRSRGLGSLSLPAAACQGPAISVHVPGAAVVSGPEMVLQSRSTSISLHVYFPAVSHSVHLTQDMDHISPRILVLKWLRSGCAACARVRIAYGCSGTSPAGGQPGQQQASRRDSGPGAPTKGDEGLRGRGDIGQGVCQERARRGRRRRCVDEAAEGLVGADGELQGPLRRQQLVASEALTRRLVPELALLGSPVAGLGDGRSGALRHRGLAARQVGPVAATDHLLGPGERERRQRVLPHALAPQDHLRDLVGPGPRRLERHPSRRQRQLVVLMGVGVDADMESAAWPLGRRHEDIAGKANVRGLQLAGVRQSSSIGRGTSARHVGAGGQGRHRGGPEGLAGGLGRLPFQ